MDSPAATDRNFWSGDPHHVAADPDSTGRADRSGWLVMRDCLLDRTIDHPQASIKFGMVHPEIGIALIDLAPDQTPDAVARLRRKLFSGAFPKSLPSQLPIVYRALPKDQLPRVGAILDYAFAVEPPIPPAYGTAWVEAVCWALAAEPVPIRPAGARDGTAARPVSRLRASTTAAAASGTTAGPANVAPRRRPAARPVIRLVRLRTPRWPFVAGGGLLLGLLTAFALLPFIDPGPSPGGQPRGTAERRLDMAANDRDAPSPAIPPPLTAARIDQDTSRPTPAAFPMAVPPAPVAAAQSLPAQAPATQAAAAQAPVAPIPVASLLQGAEVSAGEARRVAMGADGPGARAISMTTGRPDPADRGATGSGRPTVTPDVAELLFRRGDQAREQGDLSAARLLYARAAEAGHAGAALAAGRAFDPDFLQALKATGLRGEPAVAAAWYRHASALGAPEAAALLQKLEERAARTPPPAAPRRNRRLDAASASMPLRDPSSRMGRAARHDMATDPAMEAGGVAGRCRLIVQRLQIGETVPDGDIRFLQHGCQG